MSTVHQQSDLEKASWTRIDLPEWDPARTRLSLPELRELASSTGGPHVSIYLPTQPPGGDLRQNPRRFESLLVEADVRLRQRGLADHLVDPLLEPGLTLLPKSEFWDTSRRGLAVLLSDGEPCVIKLPYEVESSCYVSDRFRIAPLLPLVEDDRFVLLAFSRAQVRLFAGDRDGLQELPRREMPSDFEEVVGSDVEPETLQAQAAGRGMIFHGSAVGKDDREQELERFLHEVAVGLPSALPRRDLPIVLAGVERNVAELRRQLPNLRVAEQAVIGEPSDLGLPELHAAAWECAQPLLQKPLRRAIERIGGQFITARATTDLATVLHSSREGRCDVLLVAFDVPCWGSHDPTTGDVSVHEERLPEDEDLVDLAIAYALERGTEVHALPIDEMPGGGVVAALHRY